MQSASVVNSQVIRNHQTNTSPSKIAYKFSQNKRFKQPNPQCPVAFYANQSQLSNRKTSFGYGHKLDFTKTLNVTPSPTQYPTKSLFEQSKLNGKSFGLSRDKSPDKSYLIPQLNKIPGPGQYENQVETKMRVSYTMRPKTIDMIDKNLSYKVSPGPGSYQSIQLQPKSGRFSLSKFSDGRFAKFTNTTNRFINIKDSPGPSNYNQGDNMSPKGKYILSHRIGRGSRIFNKTARSSFTDQFAVNKKRNPGPGQYERPSDFGVYGDAKYYKTLNSFKSTIE